MIIYSFFWYSYLWNLEKQIIAVTPDIGINTIWQQHILDNLRQNLTRIYFFQLYLTEYEDWWKFVNYSYRGNCEKSIIAVPTVWRFTPKSNQLRFISCSNSILISIIFCAWNWNSATLVSQTDELTFSEKS